MFAVIENTPGYPPEDDDPLVTSDYDQAVGHANTLADELEEQGFMCDRSWASADNYYAIRCIEEGEHKLPRVIEVTKTED